MGWPFQRNSVHFPSLSDDETLDWSKRFEQLSLSAKDERLKRYYSVPIVAGNTPLKDVSFVALDFETTGLNSNSDAILTIGLVPFTIKRIQCNGSAHWVVNPNKKLNKESVVIHGITDTDVLNAPQFETILDDFFNCIAGRVIVVHYKSIERQFLTSALMKSISEGIEFPVVDTLDIEYVLEQRRCEGWFNWLRGRKTNSVRLGHCRERYGLPSYQPHNALTDALATAELLQAQIQHHFTEETTLDLLWQ